MTAPTSLTFADVLNGTAWHRVDDVRYPDTRTAYRVAALHHTPDCPWPASTDWRQVVRGPADIVDCDPGFDTCDGWGDSTCPDAPQHARPVSVCPECGPALCGREVA